MLSKEQINENKLKYIELLTKLGIDLTNLTRYLDSKRVDFFNKPFNDKNDMAYAGSLCEHSLRVYEELTKLANLYAPGTYSEVELIKVALFKDIYRAELYEPYTRNRKNDETGQWESYVDYRAKDERPVFGNISFSSYMIAKKFIDLDNDELVEAIVQSSTESSLDSYQVRKSYKLVTLTMMAEIAATYLAEE